jgi:hypothetical protein
MLLVWPLLWLYLKLSSDTDAACVATALAVFKIVQLTLMLLV